MSWNDFADADEQTGGDIIPHKTLAKVHMKIRPGGYNDESKGWTGGYATRSDTTGSVYLDCEFTVIGGKYNKHKVWSLIGLDSPNGPKWEKMGRSFIRAALESARSVKPQDTSETAMRARRISSFADLDGLEFVAQIDVQKGEGDYGDKNKINNVIPVTHREYASLMHGTAPVETGQAQQSNTAASSVPAWAQ